MQVFGKEPASQFGPLKFQLVRDAMVAKGWSRSYINKQCGRIKRAFRWGVTRELVTSAFCGALREVEGLKKGRTTAPETEDVQPVARGVVEATLPFLSSVVADMVSLQLETGCRPGEVRLAALRCGPHRRRLGVSAGEHKTEHQDKDRVIFIGPQGQAILRPYLLRAATDYCFSPVDAVRQMRERREASRQTPMSCGNAKGSNRKSVPTGRATLRGHRVPAAAGFRPTNTVHLGRRARPVVGSSRCSQLRSFCVMPEGVAGSGVIRNRKPQEFAGDEMSKWDFARTRDPPLRGKHSHRVATGRKRSQATSTIPWYTDARRCGLASRPSWGRGEVADGPACYNPRRAALWLESMAMSDVTRILGQIESGDPSAAEQLLPLVYDELRKLAAARMAHEKPDQTLQATLAGARGLYSAR